MVSQIGMFILPPVIFSLLVARRPTKYLWLNRIPGMLTIISTFILIFTILPGINWMMGINEQLSLPDWLGGIENWMRESEEEAARLTEVFLQAETIYGLLLNLFMVALLASVGEELLFRGVLLRIFTQGFRNIHIAVWLSAILFSLFHLQFYGFLPRMALGVIFGYLLVWSGSLWLPILAHFINNASAVIAYYFYNNGTSETPVESFGDVENDFLFALSLLISAIVMVMIYFLNKDNRISNQNQITERLNG
jgi:membrane protease YdiL (CAAX protease family)